MEEAQLTEEEFEKAKGKLLGGEGTVHRGLLIGLQLFFWLGISWVIILIGFCLMKFSIILWENSTDGGLTKVFYNNPCPSM